RARPLSRTRGRSYWRRWRAGVAARRGTGWAFRRPRSRPPGPRRPDRAVPRRHAGGVARRCPRALQPAALLPYLRPQQAGGRAPVLPSAHVNTAPDDLPGVSRGSAADRPVAGPARARPASAASAICRSSSHPALAARISGDIQAARRGRVSSVAVAVDAPAVGLTCSLNGSRHFDSASVVKVTILGALLRKALDQNR